LTPALAVGERYDDNIFEDNSNKSDDFVTVVSPGILLRYLPMRDAELNLDYRADIEFFADHTEENQVAHHGLFSFTTPLTRIFSINVRDAVIATDDPNGRRLPTDEETGGRPASDQSRARTFRNRADVTLGMQLAPRALLDLIFASLIEDVDIPQEVDEYRYTIGTEFGYLVHTARASRVTVSYNVTFHKFVQNEGGITAADFNVHQALVGFRHDFSPTLSGNVAMGYAVVTSDDPTQDGDSTLVANLGITKTLRTGQAAFAYRRGFTSGGGTGGSVVADVLTASFATNITPKVTASLSMNLSFFDYQKATQNDRVFWTIRPSLTYQILQFWRLLLSYDYALTDYDRATTADEYNHRVIFLSQFRLRPQIFLDLNYRYTSRHFSTGTAGSSRDESNRNEIMLRLTYAPTFRF
jgi:hypothetical protein